MPRLARPLNPQASAAADERLYAAHENDLRPNELFDVDGNRLPLDGSNPSLNEEWKQYYREANEATSVAAAAGEKGTRGSDSGAQKDSNAPTTFANRGVSHRIENARGLTGSR